MICHEKKEMDFLDRKELKDIQSSRLKNMVNEVYNNVPFYRKKMDNLNLTPNDIKSIDDIKKLPFTTKEDLRNNYPYKLFNADMKDIIRIHASSGTTGKPTVVGYTKNDLNVWSDLVRRALTAYGVTNNDILQVAYGYGLFTGGLGVHGGGESLGSTVIPVSSGNTAKQLQILTEFGSTALACTPSYALFLADALERNDININELNLKIGIFGGEPWTEAMRDELQKRLNIKAYQIYGLCEIMGPGVSFECSELSGLHINEDHFYPEIIDSDTLEVLPEGSLGELVLTTLTKEGMPLLRYRTRDITKLNYEPCKCGRTLVRMEKCLARDDDMLIIRGVNVFPTQIDDILREFKDVRPNFLLVVDRVNNLDVLEVIIEMRNELSSYGSSLETISTNLKQRIRDVLNVSVKLQLVEPYSIVQESEKAKRVIDKRKY